MRIKSITYDFLYDQVGKAHISIGDTFVKDGVTFAISSIREVGNAFNIYVKNVTEEKDLTIDNIKKIDKPERIVYSIKATNIVIEYFIKGEVNE